jgi:subfamily B ATP-binding cassette protein MsbA
MRDAATRRLDALARRYTWSLPVVAGFSIVGTALEGVGVALVIPLLGLMLQGSDQDALELPFGGLASLIPGGMRVPAIIIAILVLLVIKNALHAYNLMFMAKVEGKFGHDVRSALSQSLLDVGYPFFLSETPSRVVNAVTTESWRTSAGYRQVMAGASAAAALSVFAVLILLLDWRLAAVVLAGTLAIRVVENYMIARTTRLSDDVTNVNDALAERMMHNVLAMRMLRIFGQEQFEQSRFVAASDGVRRALLNVERASAIVSPTLEVLHIGLLVAVLLVAMVSGGIALPTLAAFLVLLQRAQPHLRELEYARTHFAAARGAFTEIERLLDPEGKPARPTGSVRIGELSQAVEFQGVSYTYPGRTEPAINGVTLTLRAGRSTALIGQSGSGKSTLINLLCRLVEPSSGTILVDGLNLATIDPLRWRSMLGVAGQDVELADGSVADNIAYGVDGATREAIVEAAKRADAHSFIEAMPNGYETRVGTRGTNLSGGQRQRIGLARAFVRKPQLLILDEATNEIDGISEHTILSLLRDHPDDMTLCVISHRVSTLALCDDGVALAGGRVVESGPLRELAAYRSMSSAGS